MEKVKPEMKLWFRTICVKNGFIPTDLQLDQLDQYVNLLLEWNKKINLISRKDEANIWSYHILHSISPLFKIKIKEGSSIVDIGSGGGLPGIPLRILCPRISLLCLDATRKKVNAVSQMVDGLKLEHVHVVWGRAEDIGLQPEFFKKFDFAFARAVCPLNELIALSVNFIKKGDIPRSPERTNKNDFTDPNPPVLIAFKGGDLTKEIESAKRQYPQATINTIDLSIKGSEQFIASDKKILVVHI